MGILLSITITNKMAAPLSLSRLAACDVLRKTTTTISRKCPVAQKAQVRFASDGWTARKVLSRMVKQPQFETNPNALAFYVFVCAVTGTGIYNGLQKQKPEWGHAADEDKIGIVMRDAHH